MNNELQIDTLGEVETWKAFESIVDLESDLFEVVKNGINIKFNIASYLQGFNVDVKRKDGKIIIWENCEQMVYTKEEVDDEMRLRMRYMKKFLREYYDSDKVIKRRNG